MSPSQIDAIILSQAKPLLKKVAMIVSKSADECERQGHPVAYEEVAARIEALVAAGQLEAVGNLSNWRRSEVRLPSERQP